MKPMFSLNRLSRLLLVGSLFLSVSSLQAAGTVVEAMEAPPSHHHAVHVQNPLVARYKALYPRRVHLTLEESDRKFTILNEGKDFQVLEGHYGVPNLLMTMPEEEVEKVYGMVQGGNMPEGIPRIEMAMVVKEFSEVSLDNPQVNDPEKSGPGPKLNKFEGFLSDFIKTKNKGVKFMGLAGTAKAAGKKLPTLYYGLISKLAFKKADKMMEKTAARLLKELGRDLEEGQQGLTPGGSWSTFVDMHCFYNLIQSPQNFGDVCAALVDRIQGVLVYHKTLPQNPDLERRTAILEDRLAIVEKLIALNDT